MELAGKGLPHTHIIDDNTPPQRGLCRLATEPTQIIEPRISTPLGPDFPTSPHGLTLTPTEIVGRQRGQLHGELTLRTYPKGTRLPPAYSDAQGSFAIPLLTFGGENGMSLEDIDNAGPIFPEYYAQKVASRGSQMQVDVVWPGYPVQTFTYHAVEGNFYTLAKLLVKDVSEWLKGLEGMDPADDTHPRWNMRARQFSFSKSHVYLDGLRPRRESEDLNRWVLDLIIDEASFGCAWEPLS